MPAKPKEKSANEASAKAFAGIQEAKAKAAAAASGAAAREAPGGMVVAARGVLWSKGDIAAALNVTFNTVSAWEKKGLRPLVPGDPKRSQPTLFDSMSVWEFRLAQELAKHLPRGDDPLGEDDDPRRLSSEFLNLDQERARLAREQRLKLEMENAKSREELLPAAEVRAAREHVYGNLRARLLSTPAKLAPLVASETNRALCARLIEDAIYEALQELSETRLTPSPDVDRATTVSPGAKPKPKSRGKRKRSRPRAKAAKSSDGK